MPEAAHLARKPKGVCLNLKPYLEAVSEFPKQEACEGPEKQNKTHTEQSQAFPM